MRIATLGAVFTVTLVAFGGVLAQAPASAPAPAPADHWEFTIAPYLLAPNMQGTTSVGTILPPVSVNATPSDVFSHLQMGAMLYFGVKKGSWAFATDALYMDLQQDIVPDATNLSGSVHGTQAAWEAFVLYRFALKLEVGVGGLWNKMDMGITVGPSNLHAKAFDEQWGAPVLAMRWTPVGGQHWHALLFADYGGTSGSNWTWQVMPSVGYKFGKLFELSLQYRWIAINYSTTNFGYRMNIFGPQMGFGFHF